MNPHFSWVGSLSGPTNNPNTGPNEKRSPPKHHLQTTSLLLPACRVSARQGNFATSEAGARSPPRMRVPLAGRGGGVVPPPSHSLHRQRWDFVVSNHGPVVPLGVGPTWGLGWLGGWDRPSGIGPEEGLAPATAQ